MKKCLLLIPRMGNGGAERVMATIANNLCKEYEVRIVTLTDDKCFYDLNPKVTVIGLGQKIDRNSVFSKCISGITGGIKDLILLKKMLSNWNPDVLLSFLGPATMVALLLKLLGAKCRVVVSERYDPSARGKMYQWMERNFFPFADKIVCQSQKAAGFFKEKHRGKVVIIPNPISADAIPERHEGKRKRTIVAVGRLSEQKNFTLLINAFAKLSQDYRDFTLEIYGGGELEGSLHNEIQRLRLENRVFLMGIKQKVMHSIADAAVFVMSSDYEGFPNALVEAMATGLPVISTDFPTGVARELIGPQNGIVVPTGDEAAMICALEEILKHEEKWEEMSKANREMLAYLSEERIIKMWEDILFT